MGIQGLGGYLDNNNLTVYFNPANTVVNDTFKYIYFDFQSIIYTIFNYQENLINLMLSNIASYDTTNTNIDNNKLIFAILDQVRLLIKDTNFGKNLFNYSKNVPTVTGLKSVTIDLRDTEIKYTEGAVYTNISLLDNIKDGINNYISNKMDYVRSSIIEQIFLLVTQFNNLEECYIVFDGKPLIAKMIEQVKRRVPDAILSQIISDIKTSLVEDSVFTAPNEITFDRSVISKDSPFITSLISDFTALSLKVKSDPSRDLKISVISTEDGEGEHIINKKILEQVDSGADGNFLYYSPDGDVVLLILILNILIRQKGKTNYVNLIKFELIDYTYYKFNSNVEIDGSTLKLSDYMSGDDSIETKISVIKKILSQIGIYTQFNNISDFENRLLENINTKLGFKHTEGATIKKYILRKDLMLMQYIILFTVFGNDFLPKLLSITVGQMDDIVESYNKYLIDTATGNLREFLNRTTGNINKFKFLVKFDGTNYNIDKNVLLDFFKLLCKSDPAIADSCKKNEDGTIIKRINAESKKGSKHFVEYMDGFAEKKVLFNYKENIIGYEFLKYLLYGNYFIDLSNLSLEASKKTEYLANITKINILLSKSIKTPEEAVELKTLEKKYYKEVLNDSALKYIKYYFNDEANPTIVNTDKIKVEEKKKDKLIKRIVPFSEIINFDSTMKAESNLAITQYIQGFQYITDLYFTGNVKNKCWYYQFENPPRLDEIIKYMETNIASDLLNYSGFYGASHSSLYDKVSQKLTRSINIKYIKNIRPVKYYKLKDIFHCLNMRYINKCQIKGDTGIIFLDDEGKLVNIMSSSFDISSANTKLTEILRLASEVLVGGKSLYYDKYLKYKLKYLKLKKLI
jgi:hypothetical protein